MIASPRTPLEPYVPAAQAEPEPADEQVDESAAWDEAFVRVESYLRAYRLERRTRLTRLTAALIDRAHLSRQPRETPVAAAMREADRHITRWIERVVGPTGDQPELARARARLAIEIADVPERWPDAFLADGPLPEALQHAMQAAYLEAGPELHFSNMAPRPIDLGPVANLAGQTWDNVRQRPRLRVLLLGSALAFIAFSFWQLFHP